MKTGFFQEDNGNYSIIRAAFAALLIYAMIETSLGIHFVKWTAGEAIAFFSAVAAVATGGKLLQKSIEKPE